MKLNIRSSINFGNTVLQRFFKQIEVLIFGVSFCSRHEDKLTLILHFDNISEKGLTSFRNYPIIYRWQSTHLTSHLLIAIILNIPNHTQPNFALDRLFMKMVA